MSVLGIDIGRTKVELCLEDILHTKTIPAEQLDNPEQFFANLKKAVESFCGDRMEEVTAIGVSFPGPINYTTGKILQPTLLEPFWDFEMAPMFEQYWGRPVVFLGGTNAVLLAARAHHKLTEFSEILGLTLGTGFGMGLIYQGELFLPEQGPPVVFKNPLDGKSAEDYISKRGLLWLAWDKYESAEAVIEAAKMGEDFAGEVMQEFGRKLAQAIVAAVNFCRPQAIVYSGGLAEGDHSFLSALKQELFQHTVLAEDNSIFQRAAKECTPAYGLVQYAKRFS